MTIPLSTTNTGNGELRADAGTLAITTLTNVSGNTVTGGKYTATGSGNLQLPIGGTGKLLTNAAAISLSGANSKISSPTVANALGVDRDEQRKPHTGEQPRRCRRTRRRSRTRARSSSATAPPRRALTVAGAYNQTAGTTTVALLSTLTPTASTVTISGGTLNGAGTVSRPVRDLGDGNRAERGGDGVDARPRATPGPAR